mmetsp:Transcript_35611/g.80447  ORF Transcript_35611/g.80447 Transcript_35611/m.80447 type:complete len:491 (+) Transcript_35611:566-2038(+)
MDACRALEYPGRPHAALGVPEVPGPLVMREIRVVPLVNSRGLPQAHQLRRHRCMPQVEQGERADGVRRGCGASRALEKVDGKVLPLVGRVHHDNNERAVRVCEGSGLEHIPAAGAEDPLGAGLDVPREVPNVEIRGLEQDLVVLGVSNDRRGTHVADMVRASTLVEVQVPVDPALTPVVEVFDDTLCVTLAHGPVTNVRAQLLAGLRHQEMLLRLQVMDACDVVKTYPTSSFCPPLSARIAIPMVAHAPDILGSVGIGVDGLRAQEEVAAIVVPANELQVHSTGLQGWAQVVTDEVALLLRAEEAVLPTVGCIGLVLHREAPQRKPKGLQLLGEAHVEIRPDLAALRLELATAQHGLRVLHPGWGTPGTGEELERTTSSRHRPFDHGEYGLLVVLDREVGKRGVCRLVAAAPVAVGEVARVHVNPTQVIAQATGLVEVCVYDPLLICRADAPQHIRRGLRECPAKTEIGLVCHGGVEEYRGLVLVWRRWR